jgi:hypothetical protein
MAERWASRNRDLARLEHPMSTLEGLHGLIVIDEIQRKPELFAS